MATALEVGHRHDGDEMSQVETVRRGVESRVYRAPVFFEPLPQGGIAELLDEAARLELVHEGGHQDLSIFVSCDGLRRSGGPSAGQSSGLRRLITRFFCARAACVLL